MLARTCGEVSNTCAPITIWTANVIRQCHPASESRTADWRQLRRYHHKVWNRCARDDDVLAFRMTRIPTYSLSRFNVSTLITQCIYGGSHRMYKYTCEASQDCEQTVRRTVEYIIYMYAVKDCDIRHCMMLKYAAGVCPRKMFELGVYTMATANQMLARV